MARKERGDTKDIIRLASDVSFNIDESRQLVNGADSCKRILDTSANGTLPGESLRKKTVKTGISFSEPAAAGNRKDSLTVLRKQMATS